MSDKFDILIVEDDENTFRILDEALGSSIYKLWRVTTAEEALKLAKGYRFMAIITELHLPDMDGIELIRRIKKISARVNIIILTSYSFIDLAVKGLEASAYTYLLKPLHAEEVKIMLKRAIENTALLIQAGKKNYFQDMAVLDGLTGIYNHRYFYEVLDWQIAHLRRFPQKFSMFMIDVDDFKKYNDNEGHVAGDKVLYGAAQLFLHSSRDSDMVFRYGGEEFVVLMPQTSKEHAKNVGERILKSARNQLPVTVSIGLSTFTDDTQTRDDLVIKADKALYRAKRMGKDRLCFYDKNLDK